jgi:hypothetical protein
MRARVLARRSVLGASVAVFAALGVAACSPSALYKLQPGSLKKGSRLHAFQTATIAWSFTSAIARQWDATIKKVQQDVPPLLVAMRDGGHAAQIVVKPRRANEGGPEEAQYDYYDADFVVVPAPREASVPGKKRDGRGPAKAGAKDGAKGDEPLVIGGRAGTDKSVYQADAAVVAKATGVPMEQVRDGHFALYGLANILTPLNVSNDALQRHAFKLLVLREKIKAGEQADWFGGNREPQESLADLELALRVIADHHAAVADFRSEVIGVIALANGYKAAEGVALLEAQLVESRARNDAWVAAHPRPTMEDFGVAMNEFKLPTPTVLLEQLDENGYIAAAVTIARGVATGSVGTTLEGVSKLAPKDGTVRIVLEGLAAASRGDLVGTGASVAKLVGKATEGTAIGKRLDQLREGVATVKGGAAQVADALGKAKGDLGDLGKSTDPSGLRPTLPSGQ